MKLTVAVGSFGGKAEVQEGKAIISGMGRHDFPVSMEELERMDVNKIRVFPRDLQFEIGIIDGWTIVIAMDEQYDKKRLIVCRWRTPEPGIRPTTREYLSKKGEWRPYPYRPGLPRNIMKIPIHP